MTRTSTGLAIAAISFAMLLAGCADAAPDPSTAPSTSEALSATPSSTPDALAYDEVPINCLNVLSPELREAILGMADVTVGSVRQLPGPMAASGEQGFATLDRWVSCDFLTPDATTSTGVVTVTMSEFDAASTQAAADALLAAAGPGADVGEVPGIEGGTIVRLDEPGNASVGIVLPGRRFDIGGAPAVEVPVAAVPDATFDQDAFTAALGPVGPGCQVMIPQGATSGTDAAGAGWVLTEDYGTGSVPLGCIGFTATETVQRALWWEDLGAERRDALLDGAASGVDGLSAIGTTDDGAGAILAADAGLLIVFDVHLVHMDLPVDAATGLGIARTLRAPAWLDVLPLG